MSSKLTLYKLLQRKNQQGFILAMGYYAEIDSDTAGMFPVVESESQAMVMTIDMDLLKRVCKALPPRQFKLGVQLLYVNPKTGKAYSISGPDKRSLARELPFQSLTMARFNRLSRKRGSFKWCSITHGNSGKEISRKAFRLAINKLSASRF